MHERAYSINCKKGFHNIQFPILLTNGVTENITPEANIAMRKIIGITRSKKGKYDSDNYKTYHYTKKEKDCFFIVEAQEGVNLERYVNSFQEENSKKEEQTIHNNKWIVIRSKERNHYLIKHNNYLYHVLFQTQDNDSCKELEKIFTSTLEFK